MRRLIALLAAGLAALGLTLAVTLAAGGGDGSTTPAPPATGTIPTAHHPFATSKVPAALQPGHDIFVSAGCTGCHTLADAGATGTVGPNLDQRRPSKDQVTRRVTRGAPGMPSFSGRLSPEQIRQVAEYVAAASRTGMPVVGVFKRDKRTLADCAVGDFTCYEQAFGNLVFAQGPKRALVEFADKMNTDSQIEANCHRIAHAMGAAALTRVQGRVGVALAEGAATCWSGYYHGVLERSLAGVSDRQLPRHARKACAGAAVRQTTFIAYQCVHGLGHGLMIHTSYDLPLALKICDKLATGWDQTSCTGGVFMENLSSSYGIESQWLKDDDLIYPCNIVAERHKLYCYLMVTSRILQETGYNWETAAQTCRTAEANWVRTCFQSLGRDASGNTRQDPAGILAICEPQGDMQGECLYGASRDMTSNDAGGQRAKVLCDTAPEASRPYCWFGIGTIIGTLRPYEAERRADCAALTTTYREQCVSGSLGEAPPPVETTRPS
jgi:mono/diheme cytochrome c family protein